MVLRQLRRVTMPFDDADLMELKQLRDQLRDISHTLQKILSIIRAVVVLAAIGLSFYFIFSVWDHFLGR